MCCVNVFYRLLDAAAYVTFRTLGVYARRVRVFNKDKNMITSTPNKSLNKPLQSSSSSTSSSNSSSPLMKSSSSSSSLLKSSYSNSTLRNANTHNNSNNNNNNNEHIVKTSGINKHCLRTLTNNFKYNSNDVISNKNDNDKDFRHNQPLAAA